MLAPIVSEVAEEFGKKVKVCKIDVDENEELAVRYKIQSIPTVMIFKNGIVTETIIGYRQKDAYLAALNK
jgi:thioredoxin 1